MRLDSQTPNQKQGFTIDAQHHFTYSGLWLVHLSPPQRTPPRNKGLSVGVYVGGGGVGLLAIIGGLGDQQELPPDNHSFFI